jgi:hypothetical protein
MSGKIHDPALTTGDAGFVPKWQPSDHPKGHCENYYDRLGVYGSYCTRPADHPGDHAAHIDPIFIAATWPAGVGVVFFDPTETL